MYLFNLLSNNDKAIYLFERDNNGKVENKTNLFSCNFVCHGVIC